MATKKCSSLVPATTGGLGHNKTEWYHETSTRDHAKLTDKLSDQITQKHLDKLISVIHQMDENTDELKKLKGELIQLCLAVKDRLLKEFMEKNWGFKKISDLEKYLEENTPALE